MERRVEYYQEGNTLRTQLVEIPAYEEELLTLPKEQERPRPQRQSARGLDFSKLGVFLLLTALTVLFAVGGVLYLRLSASITASRSHIYAMEQELMQLRANNEMTAKRMEAEVDLAEVYQVATVQLGMVHADGSEMIRYEEQVREYVRQYENIPGK